MVKGIGFFISGAVVGSVATYIFMKSKQTKIEQETQAQINLIKKDYTWKKDEAEDESRENTPEDEGNDDEEDHREMYNYAVKSEKMRKANRERNEEKKVFRSVKNQDYLDDMLEDEEDDEDEDDDDDYYDDGNPYPDDGDGGVLSPSEGPHDHPYSISASTFANTCNHFDKCTLLWYSVDDVLTDEENDRIVDMSIVGDDWRDHVGEYEEGVAYIRNESIAVDYEIIKENLSFFRDAL